MGVDTVVSGIEERLEKLTISMKEFTDTFNHFISIQMEMNIKVMGILLDNMELDEETIEKIMDSVAGSKLEDNWEEFPNNDKEVDV